MYTQILLLLFALHSLSAYTVMQIELKNGTEVSEVKEITQNPIKYISPESKLPTLREIIFVVEKYGKPEEKDNRVKQRTSQETPIELDASLRPFTNGHGYQFADLELVDEHQPRADDKAEDKTDNGSDSDDDAVNYDDTDDEADKDDDETDNHDDETDKHDDETDNHEVTVPVIDPRNLDIEMAKKSRNKMFDEVKEKYQSIKRSNVNPTEKLRRKRQLNYQTTPGASHNVDLTAFPDYMNRMKVNRPSFDNSKQVINPALRDENVNILHDNHNMNNVLADGRQFGNMPRSYGTNLNTDQRYSLNYINNMQNEPNYNHHYSQPVQQRPIESPTVNNNPYKQIKQSNNPNVELRKQSNNPDVELKNVKRTLDKNELDNIQKFNQAPNYYKPLNRVPKESENKNKNVAQIIDVEKVRNNEEADMTLRNKVEMKNNVNQMSKKISNIKEKVKNGLANINEILNTPEGRKFLAYRMNMASDKVGSSNDITGQHVSVNEHIPRDSKNLTKTEKPENKSNRIIATNNVGDTNNIRNNFSNDRDRASNSFTDFVGNKNKEINVQMGQPTVNQNYKETTSNQIIVENNYNQMKPPSTVTLTATGNENINIKKEKESSLVQTIVENKYDQPKPPTTEKYTGTGTTNIEKDKESSLVQAIVENEYEKLLSHSPNTEILTATRNETTNIKEDKESSLVQTVVENKYYQPEPPTTKTLTATPSEITNIEKDKECLLVDTIVENKCDQLEPPTTKTLTATHNETANIDKDKEFLLVDTIVENKCDQPEPPTTETLAATCNKTTNIEKDKESSLVQTILENKYDHPETHTSKTLAATCNETTNIEKDEESLLVETIVENKFDQPEPLTTEIFNDKCNETTNIEIDKACSLFPIPSENIDKTSASDIKEDRQSELIEEIIKETFLTNKTNERCNNNEKCNIVDGNNKETNFENLSLYDFLNTEKFNADGNKIDNNSDNLFSNELFDKDEFWIWLSKWTKIYMELLNEDVETIVKEELATNMEEINSIAEKQTANKSGESNAYEELDKRKRR